jgi:hypothetical protein
MGDFQNNSSIKDQAEKQIITGPQGHGFYTSGPWKIDTMGAEALGQFSNPEFLMSEYFASMMSPQSSVPETSEETSNPEDSQNCHVFGNLTICDDAESDHSNDFVLMDMTQNDVDMAIMMF